MSSAATHPKPSPTSPDVSGGVAARFRSWAAEQGPTAQQPKKPSESVRELSYDEALRSHARFQPLARPAQMAPEPAQLTNPAPRTRPVPPPSHNDGALTRPAQTDSSFGDVIQAQIEHLSKADPELVSRWLANNQPAVAPEESANPAEPEETPTAANPFLLAFHSAQADPLDSLNKDAAQEEESPLIYAEDHVEEDFRFAQQLEREEPHPQATLSPGSPKNPQPVLSFHPYAQKNGRMMALTVRLTPEDCEEVRQRAKEAGMSISAYLRACALEVDQLRAQVKQMIATLREEQPEPQTQGNLPTHTASLLSRILKRIFPLRAEPAGDY